MDIVVNNVEAVAGAVIGLLTAAAGLALAWKKVFSKHHEEEEPVPVSKQKVHQHHEECLQLARDAREQVKLLEQKVSGEVHLRLTHIEDDIETIFTKMEKTLDLMIAQMEKSNNAP